MRIISISSSRADVGILCPVWRALADAGVELHIVATGMHRAKNALDIDLDGIDAQIHYVGRDLGGCADKTAAAAMAAITEQCGALYATLQPDCVLVVGDRLDMIPAAVATLPFNFLLAHLHGGEVTEGAIDDRTRHAVTELASLHLVSCEGAASFLRRKGIDPSSIIITGAPGLDTLLAAPTMERGQFLRTTGLDGISGADKLFVLATVHPETNSHDPQAPLVAVLDALDELRVPVLFTAPNSDPGGALMLTRLKAWIEQRPFALFVDTLGSKLYPNALRHAAAMLGNSSSGIIEAGLFGLPVVDVGERQKGRDAGANVEHVASDPKYVSGAARSAIVRDRSTRPESLYGDGLSGPRIAKNLIEFLSNRVGGVSRLQSQRPQSQCMSTA